MPKLICKNVEKSICEEYTQCKITQKELALKYGISRLSISHILIRNNIPKMKHGEYESKNTLDETFFDNLTDKSAYWLGFIFGDGNIQKDTLRIMLSINDLVHLKNFAEDINSNHKLVIGNKDSSYSKSGKVEFCNIAISRKSLVSSLKAHGLGENKTLRQTLPSIDKTLMSSFIRGYLDADGCVFISKKNRSSCAILFTGNQEFVNGIREFFIKELGIFPGEIKKDIRNSYTFVVQKGIDKIKLFDFLYKDATRCLQRKYDKFKQIVTLYGDIQMKLGEPISVGCAILE